MCELPLSIHQAQYTDLLLLVYRNNGEEGNKVYDQGPRGLYGRAGPNHMQESAWQCQQCGVQSG